MAKVVGNWEGGRVIEVSSGRRVYYIRRRVRGRLYEVSTHAATLKAALAHLQRFEASPHTYDPTGAPRGPALTVTGLMDDYLDYCLDKKDSANWRYQKRRYLKWWARARPGDVRSFTRQGILAALEGQAAPHNRLAALKAFCAWLREVKGAISRAEDVPADIPIPAPKPAQWSKPRAITREVFSQTMAHLPQPWADIIGLLGATGMHTTEALRFAQGKGSIAGTTLTLFHKSGRQHRMGLEPRAAEVAQRVQKRGGFSISRLMNAVAAACVKAKVPHWVPGALRHSVPTWLIGGGASIEAVAAYLT